MKESQAVLFVSQKNQKNFGNPGPRRCTFPALEEQKFFGSFFQKRSAFSCSFSYLQNY
jgi:hypothetical protein